MQDPYEALELSAGASAEEVDAAYRRLARQWHPDRHVSASAEERAVASARMAEVAGAYQLLQDPMALARYRAAHRRVQAHAGEAGTRPSTGNPTESSARLARPTTSAGATSQPFDYRRAAPSEFGRAAPGPSYGYTSRPDASRRRVPPAPPAAASRRDHWRYWATIAAILLVVPVVVVGILDAVTGRSEPRQATLGTPSSVAAGSSHDVAVLRVGDCFDAATSEREEGSARVHSVARRPCDQAHESEAIAVLDVGGLGPAYPGPPAIAAHVSPRCEHAFAATLGVPYVTGTPLILHWIHPSRESWLRGDRRVVCAVSPRERLHVKGHARDLVSR